MEALDSYLIEVYYKTPKDDTDQELHSVLSGADIPYKLQVVEDVSNFREKSSQLSPEIILLDALLPRQEIIEAIKFAADKAPNASIFIIVKTLNQVAEAMSIEGITGFLIKGRIKQLIPFLAKIASERAEKMQAENERNTLFKYLEAANILFIVCNAEGDLVRINNYGCNLLECDREYALGKNWIETFIPDDEKTRVYGILEQFNKHHLEPVKYQVNDVITKSGNRKTIAFNNSILYNKQGNVTDIVSFGADITDKRKYEAAMDAYARFAAKETGTHFFEALVLYLTRMLQADVALVSKFEGDYKEECRTLAVADNNTLQLNFSYKIAESVVAAGNGAVNLIDVPEGNPYLLEKFEGKAALSVLLTGYDGQNMGELVFLSRKKIENPVLTKLILQLFSIRAGAEMEHMLKTAEINALNNLLRERAKELLRVTDDLQQLSYVISHDFSDPLRAISSLLDVFNEKFGAYNDPELQQYLNLARQTADQSQKIMGRILEYSRVSNRGNSFEVTQLNFIVHKAKQQNRDALAKAGAIVNIEPLPVGLADEEQMITLFAHLFDNAIKFRHYGRQLVIDVWAEKVERAWVFNVKDNGIGFKNSYSERIFRMFPKVNKGTSEAGSGLGLAICRKIVERHGGKIGAYSEPGIGTKVYFTLPI